MGEHTDDVDVNPARDSLPVYSPSPGGDGTGDEPGADHRFDPPEQRGAPPPELARANPARMYDYYLGGQANFKVDRQVAEQVIAVYPGIVAAARANRAFLARAVRYLLDQGIDQFLDLGSGIPTVGNVHQIAQAVTPAARVVYVDIEPVAAAHATGMLAGNPNAAVIRADLTEPETILGRRNLHGLIDLSRPVGVLMVSVLVFVPDEKDPAGVVAAYRDAISPGSYLAVSHGYRDPGTDMPGVRDAEAVYQHTTSPTTLRTRAQITGLFTGFELVAPGLVPVTAWHRSTPDTATSTAVPVLAGVARKP
ncbi:MAG TPA: SAM-dependent methyltransferase [Mycobacteriales bacterium]|nr:SAM-dependent methyltransferase [Mycobacteriales bacterium]